MEKKKGTGLWLGTIFSGKGFYIVLLLCAAVIATAVWLMVAEKETDVELDGETQAAATLPTMQEEPVVIPAAPVPELQEALDPEEGDTALVWNEQEQELPLYFIWPVSGVLERGHVTDALQYDRTMADWRTHDGWDIAAALGAHVLAAADGTVGAVYVDDLYGTVVEIDHGNGLVSCYANLAATPAVAPGDAVQVGDVIGAVGDSALAEVSEACHLHFTMKLDGVSADPARWLPER